MYNNDFSTNIILSGIKLEMTKFNVTNFLFKKFYLDILIDAKALRKNVLDLPVLNDFLDQNCWLRVFNSTYQIYLATLHMSIAIIRLFSFVIKSHIK